METKPSPFSNEKEFIKYYINKYDEYGPISNEIAESIGLLIIINHMNYHVVMLELEEYLNSLEVSEQDKEKFLLTVKRYYNRCCR